MCLSSNNNEQKIWIIETSENIRMLSETVG